jgi:hypothetical protein
LSEKELSFEERYDLLFEQYQLLDAINYAFHKEQGIVDEYYEFYTQAQQRTIPSYLGPVLGIFKAITPGRAFKQVVNQMLTIFQAHHELSQFDISWISDREVSIGLTNCHTRAKKGELAKKVDLDINPVAICAREGRFFQELFKDLGIDVQVTFTDTGCITTAKMT